jgi:DNA-nicking Smr family endonuclease
MRIDLHGYYIHNGWQQFNQRINEAYFSGYKKCHVITGQGAMMRELPIWASNHPRIRECVQTKHNPGSFSIKLKKKG